MRIRIQCGHCQGSGEVQLASRLAETLRLFTKGKEMNGVEVGRLLGIKATAANMRLARLEHHGLLRSVRDGRVRVFKRKE